MRLASKLKALLGSGARDVSLGSIMRGPTVASIAMLCKDIDTRGSAVPANTDASGASGMSQITALPPGIRKHSPMQLSYNQEQMLVIQEADPASPAYNGPIFQDVASSAGHVVLSCKVWSIPS